MSSQKPKSENPLGVRQTSGGADTGRDSLLYALEIGEVRAKLELAQLKLSSIENSSSWKATAALRQVLGGRPRLTTFVRRTVLLAWWAATGQIKARLRLFNEHRRALSAIAFSDADCAARGQHAKQFHPPHAPLVTVLVPFARIDDMPVHSDDLADLPYGWEIVFFETGGDRWHSDARVRYLDCSSELSVADIISRMIDFSFGRYIAVLGKFDFKLINESIDKLSAGKVDLVLAQPDDATVDAVYSWRDGTMAIFETSHWPVCREMLSGAALDAVGK